MSERFSYLCREPFGKAARQAVQVCTHARRDAAVREPQTHRQSVFTPKTKSLSSAGYVAAFTQPWGSTLQRNARLGLMHGSPPRRDSPSMNDSNPRAAVLGENVCLHCRLTHTGECQDSSGARVSLAQRQRTPQRLACPEKQGISIWHWSATTHPVLALNPSQLPLPESSTQLTQGCRQTFLPKLHDSPF